MPGAFQMSASVPGFVSSIFSPVLLKEFSLPLILSIINRNMETGHFQQSNCFFSFEQ